MTYCYSRHCLFTETSESYSFAGFLINFFLEHFLVRCVTIVQIMAINVVFQSMTCFFLSPFLVCSKIWSSSLLFHSINPAAEDAHVDYE